MRRVGKSTILNIIKDEILKDVKDENKIFINFESMEFININDEKSLSEYLKIKLKEINGKVYFFFDEIQLVKNWERVINGIRVDVDSDIYIYIYNRFKFYIDFRRFGSTFIGKICGI